MRKAVSLFAALALPLTFAACNADKQAQFISDVQNTAKAVCQFLPAAETVAAIFTANASLPAATVAHAICDAVTQKYGTQQNGLKTGEAMGLPYVMVGETPIVVKGTFVK